MKAPEIKVKPPGPLAQQLVNRDHQYTTPAYGRVYPLVVKRAQGMMVEDVDGNVFLDFMAGIAVANTGHCHPRVVAAIEEQARKLLHICGSDFYFESMVALVEKLGQMAPGAGAKKIFLANSGTETVEAAMKLARYATRRKQFIAFLGSFHGRSLGALSLTASRAAQRAHFTPLIPDVHHIPFGDCRRCSYHLRYGSCEIDCVEYLEKRLFRQKVAPEEVAAIFVEPIQGEGGYVVPPQEFLPKLQEICRRHGILLVVDEIQSGFGRTGKMFACEYWGVEPDILCVAKGIASGMPLGAMIARSEISNWPFGTHGSTFGGNPVACAAALATIELLEDGLVANAATVGAYLKDRLTELKAKHSAIADVRGLGLMIGVEFGRTNGSGHVDGARRDRVMLKCFEKGLLLLGCGESTLRFCPPLIVTRQEVATAVQIFESAVSETS